MNARQQFITLELQAEADAAAAAELAERARKKAEAAAATHRAQWEQWFTPQPLAEKLASSALRFAAESGRAPLRVLEACAGDGAIVRELLKHSDVHVTAVEIDPACARRLKDLAPIGGRLEVHTADFLEWAKGCRAGEFDLMIANPPYTLLRAAIVAGAAIADHLAILGPSSMTHGTSNAAIHDAIAPRHMRDLERRPRFSGTNCQPRRDYAALFGVPMTPELRATRYAVTYGVWRERWNS